MINSKKYIFLLLGILSLFLFHSAQALSMPVGSNDGIRDLLNTTFANAPAMLTIAQCESGSRQFDAQGNPLLGGTNKNYLGIFQIGLSHLPEAQSLGFDIYTSAGNIAYANYLYQHDGTTPWSSCIKEANATPAPITNQTAVQDPIGTNVLKSGTVYYISADGLIAYPSAAAFESYGFNSWKNVQPANSADLNLTTLSKFMPYADGTLVSDKGTVYVVSNGRKYGIISAQIFSAFGYSWKNVIVGDTTFLPAGTLLTPSTISEIHLEGTLLNINGTIYYSTEYGKMAFPSLDVFNSWGFQLKNVVIANSFDLSALNNPYAALVSIWTQGKLMPWVSAPASH